MKRNLIYHLYPMRGSTWEWNIQCLRKYLHLFNNKIVVAIVTGHKRFEDIEVIKEAFGKYSDKITFLFVKDGGQQWRESSSFKHLIDEIISDDENEITFFAHSKGAGWSQSSEIQEGLKMWSQYMYETNLRDIKFIERAIGKDGDFVAAGALLCMCESGSEKAARRVSKEPPALDDYESEYGYFFHGSFYWFNNGKLFANSLKNVDWSQWIVAENFLGNAVDRDFLCVIDKEYRNAQLVNEDIGNTAKYTENYWHKLIKEHPKMKKLFDKKWHRFEQKPRPVVPVSHPAKPAKHIGEGPQPSTKKLGVLFAAVHSYHKGDVVKYQKEEYRAMMDVPSGTSIPGFDVPLGSIWKKI